MNIRREIKIWGASICLGIFSGGLGFLAVDMGTELAKEHISVRQEIPFSQVVSPYPEWLPITLTLIMFVVGISMVQATMRHRE